MKITLHPDGVLILRENGATSYEGAAAQVEQDCPNTFPSPPAGFASATYDSTTGLSVGYDAFGNATPGIDWPEARRLSMAVPTLKAAKTNRDQVRAALELAAEQRKPKTIKATKL